jgi:hypothetical protein
MRCLGTLGEGIADVGGLSDGGSRRSAEEGKGCILPVARQPHLGARRFATALRSFRKRFRAVAEFVGRLMAEMRSSLEN